MRRTARCCRPGNGRARAARTHNDAAERARLVAQRALVAQAPVRPQAAVAHAHIQEHLRRRGLGLGLGLGLARGGSRLASAALCQARSLARPERARGSRSWRLPRRGRRAAWRAGSMASGRAQQALLWQARRLARGCDRIGATASPTRAAHPASQQHAQHGLRHSAPHHVCDGEVILLLRGRPPGRAQQQRARRGEHGAAAGRVRSSGVCTRRALAGSRPLLPAWRTSCRDARR